MNVLLIDWSTIAYPSWEKMARKDYIAETGSEIVEFTRNIAKEAYYLTQRFAPNPDDLVYFLLDSKNWRVPSKLGEFAIKRLKLQGTFLPMIHIPILSGTLTNPKVRS